MTVELKVGDRAPAFSLKDVSGTEKTLADWKGSKVVLYFYPRDNTKGCTLEANDFKDRYQAFADLGVVVAGVSADSLKSHEKFRDKNGLPFYLLSDEGAEVCEAYGVWKKKKMYGKEYMGIERSTFVIDEEGILREIYRKVKVPGHVEAVLERVKAF